MAKSILADDPQPSTRTERGIKLFRERHAEIERTGPSSYLVPSCSGEHAYVVNLKPFVCCTCPDHKRAKDLGEVCKHAAAAIIVHAKRRRVLA